ncbi:hypothetical protein [Microbacterium aurum]
MSVISGMSPAARRLRKRGFLTWGIIVLSVWLLCSLAFAGLFAQAQMSYAAAFLGGQVMIGWVFLLLGLVLLTVGIVGEMRAQRFNRRDIALANAFHDRLMELAQVPRASMYTDPDAPVVRDARLIEIERHFDQQTQGAITGTLETRMKMFASSFGVSSGRSYGTSEYYGDGRAGASTTSYGTTSTTTSGTIQGTTTAHLGLSQTTRANLMGDALFAVFEVAGDTYRVVSMSTPAAREWLADLVRGVAAHYGGDQTHAGGVIAAWVPTLVQQFGPEDVSYATDRLKSIAARDFAERDPVSITGAPVGRNAMIAVSMQLATGQTLELMPIAFPAVFGSAIGAADKRAMTLPVATPAQVTA